MKITKAQGEGQGQCTLCKKNGKWNVQWMCFLYEIEGKEGVYCKDCAARIRKEEALKSLKGILAEATETENAVCYVTSEDSEALKAAIEALEQPPIVKIREEIVDTLYVDSLIFGKLLAFREGKISADDIIEEFNRITRKEVLEIIDKHMPESSAK